MLYQVLRPISGCDASVGAVVEVDGWTNTRLLERQGFLAPAHAALAEKAAQQAAAQAAQTQVAQFARQKERRNG